MSARGYCLVTVQDGVEFVSPVAVSEEDAESLLTVDTLLHRAAGWRVVEGQRVVIARRGRVVRLVSARPVASDVAGGSETAPSREPAVWLWHSGRPDDANRFRPYSRKRNPPSGGTLEVTT